MSDPVFMTHERIMTGEEYVSYADHLKIVQTLERERDEARNQRDAWEKIAIFNAEKLGALMFGTQDGAK